MQFHPSDQQIINFNYYWLRHDIAQIDFPDRQTGSLHQADISVFWSINLHWQILSRWHYDLIERQTIEILGGLEYNACCIALQVGGSRYRQSTNFFYPQPYARAFLHKSSLKG